MLMTHPTINGRRVSHYAVLRQLGHGNLTRIFLATPRNRGPAELVVLKLLQSELAEDDDFRALFLDQAATTLALRHPHVVATHDVFADPEACGLTMEFLEGQTLARVLERVGRQRFPVDLHLHILSKVLSGLEHAHALGGLNTTRSDSVHRDVCPSNVFLTYEGEIKLLGTGFANVTRALEGRLGRPLVDVRYAAPEVLLGHSAGTSADLFGVGTLLWEAVTRQPRSAADAAVVIRKRTSGQEPELESAWADAPTPLVALCSRALALDPRDRYPSAQALRADLDAYLGRAPETSEAVLGRLPALMQSWFAAERAQMQVFVRSSLERAESNPETMTLPGVGDELAADDQEWTAQTSNGLAREQALASALDAELTEAVGSGAASALSSPLVAPPARESTTGGHRAYSSNLDTTRVRRGALRWGPDVLGAAALLLGSLVAVYSLYRHSTGDKRSEARQLAIQAEARPVAAPEPVLLPARLKGAARSESPVSTSAPTAPGKPSAEARVAATPDAGTREPPRPPTPAFFDGQAATSPHALEMTRPLIADELPRVDPELSSLQDAILTSARAKRAMKARRARDRAKRAQPRVPPARSTGYLRPRPIDDADPHIAPSSE